MIKYVKYAALPLFTFGLVLSAQADDKNKQGPGATVIATTSVSARVESIDYDTRHVTLKHKDGKLLTFKVGEVAHNFDQIKKGDKVTFEYMEAVAIDVRKADGKISDDSELSIERAPKGGKPAGLISEVITLNAAVEEIDYNSRRVTLRGSQGNTLTLKVGEQAKHFNEIKKGDQVVVQYTEALAISVDPLG